MFSQKEFIEASRDFVCVRLESYESEEHQKLVRGFLRGAFANTAFGLLAPDGKTQLSRGGRSPAALVGRGGGGVGTEQVVPIMKDIVKGYSQAGRASEATLQDFHTTRQAINVASGDQRLLVLTVASKKSREKAEETLRAVLNEPDLVGVFHHDFLEAKADEGWDELVTKEKAGDGFLVIRSHEFGLEGEVVAQLPITASASELKKTLVKANKTFAETEERKVYGEHVQEGRQKKVYFENGMPYGEDRDGDGKIDERRGRR